MVAVIDPQLNIWWLAQLLVSGLLFIILAWLVATSDQFAKGEGLLQRKWLKLHQHWWWKAIAALFDPKALVLWDFVLAGVLGVTGRGHRAIFVLGTLGTADIVGIIIKHTLKRRRPVTFTQATTSYSFPSGHALGMTIMALMVLFLFPNFWLQLLVLGLWLLVIISRLTLHAHYPSDVVGGMLLGYCWWIGAELLYLLIMR